VAIEGLRSQRIDRVARSTDPLDGCVYEVAWREVKPLDDPKSSAGGTWLVFADRSGMGEALNERFVANGQRSIRVVLGSSYEYVAPDEIRVDPSKPDDYRRFFKETFGEDGRCEGVVFLSSLDVTPFEQTTIGSLTADLAYASVSATYLTQAIVRHGFRDAPRLFLVTRGAQSVHSSDPVSVAQAPILGLGKTIAMEHGELRCARIDLPAEPSENDTDLLWRELGSKDREDQIALREKSRFVARLVDAKLPNTPNLPATIRSDRTYLITGGLGGLGLSLAKWLVEQGVRNLVLLGRKGPSEEAQIAIRAMEETGARVFCAQVDVSHEREVENVFATIRKEMLPLGGIVHAAMVLDDHTLLEQSEESFQKSFAPKALGAWNLHKYGNSEHLDFFVMYSSGASLMGSPGQGNYCASNAFLDALCRERTRCGLPGMSIQWGAFSELGAAAALDIRGKRVSYRGMGSFSPAEGLDAFRRLLACPRPEVGVVRFDPRQWVEFYPSTAGVPFFAEVMKQDASREKSTSRAKEMRERLQNASPEERLPLLERHLMEHVGVVLHLDATRIDRMVPLQSLGMDSLMSLELRNRLEASLGIKLSATVLFTYSSVSALAQRLLQDLGVSMASPVSSLQESPAHSRMIQEVQEMSEEEAEAILLSKLAAHSRKQGR
jgi:NADP-dependent 3-hydroxy acid dehydrogenase YdfG/acyl carrier protein